MEFDEPNAAQMLDAVTVEQLFSSQRRRRAERVSYYRRPKNWRQSLWIVTDQTQPQIRFLKMERGFEPLPQYGFAPPGVAEAARFGCTPEDSRELWTPILMHPKGPAEFPADQVKYFRWYRPEGLPGVLKGRRGVRFVQLENYVHEHGPLREFRCPDCNDMTFFQPSHLARHLHNSHGYDQAAIIALGQSSGINFNEGLMSLVEAAQLWEVPESEDEDEMAHTPPPPDLVVVEGKGRTPTGAEIRRAKERMDEESASMSDIQMKMILDLKQQIEDLKQQLAAPVAAAPAKAKQPAKRQLTQKQQEHMERMRQAAAAKRAEATEPALV